MIEEPKVISDKTLWQESEIQTHPAYAQVSIHHVSGNINLYGSDFTHHNFVTLSIRRSQQHRDLSRDWHLEREELIQVALSEAQYATLVSAPNRSGVPCTLQRVHGEQVPELPRRDSTKLHDDEFRSKLEKTIEMLKTQRREILSATSKLSKRMQQELLIPIDAAIREIESNIPFLVRSFSEHMETSIEKAKVEVEAYVTSTIHRAGLDVLRGAENPALSHDPEAET